MNAWVDIFNSPLFDLVKILFGIAIIILMVLIYYHETEHRDRIIAKRLGWNYSQLDFKKNYKEYFFLKIFRTNALFGIRGNFKGFSGTYNGRSFKLMRVGKSYLVAELEDTHTYHGFELMTKGDMELRMNAYHRHYKSVTLEGVEFSQTYILYSSSERDVFYDLDPDTMAKLLDIKSRYNQLGHLTDFGLEAKKNKVLVYSAYKPYIERVFVDDSHQRETVLHATQDVLVEFLDLAVELNETLK